MKNTNGKAPKEKPKKIIESTNGKSRAARNKEIRRKALLEQLKAAGLIKAVLDDCNKLSNVGSVELSTSDISRLIGANNGRLALIKKILPDAKTVELTGEEGGAIKTNNIYSIEVISPNAENTDT